MVKILLYGGCHALVLRDLLEALFSPADIQTLLLINFQLIGSGQPFPYEQLESCDAVVFSPIENKGDYNTDRLAAYCRSRRKQAICFPWMEWHGYCPGAVKGLFKGRFQWFYPELLDMAAQFDRFDDFATYAVAHFPTNEVIDHTLAHSSERVATAESRHAMNVRIADFVATHYRSSRLFLISDHPSLSLYKHVLEQIVGLLGLPWPAGPLAALPASEPQWRWRTPIFPRVAERLGLLFEDTGWRDDEWLPAKVLPLETYLSLYFHRDSVILGPLDTAHVHLGANAMADERPLDLGTRIFAKPLANGQTAGLEAYTYLETLSGREIALDRNAAFRIDAKQWRSTWSF